VLLVLVLGITAATGGQPGCGGGVPAPVAGAPENEAPAILSLPLDVAVNAMGGNVLIEREDARIFTQLGDLVVSRTYNSETLKWTRGVLDMTLQAGLFTDDTGAAYSTGNVVGPIVGTGWVLVDWQTVRTKNGAFVYGFGTTGALTSIASFAKPYPRLEISSTQILECESASSCSSLASITPASGPNGSTVIKTSDGRTVVYNYSNGLLSNAQTPQEVADSSPGESYAYDSTGLLLRFALGDKAATLTYSGRALSKMQQDGFGFWTFSTAITGASTFVSTLTSPLGNTISDTWNSSYQLTQVTDPDGFSVAFTWSGPRITGATLPNGTKMSAVYDAKLDAPISITGPDGNTVTVTYYAFGADPRARSYPVLSASDLYGQIFSQTFDTIGRVTAMANAMNETTTLTWTSAGLLSATDAAGVTTTFGPYDLLGNTASITVGPNSETPTYDPQGNLTRALIPTGQFPIIAGGVQGLGYDQNRKVNLLRLSSSVSGANPADAITIDYRPDGQTLAIHRPYGGDTTFWYSYGLLTQRCDTLDGTQQCTSFGYDGDSRLIKRVLPNGTETDITYGASRVAKVATVLNGAAPQQSKTYTYANGQLVSWTDSSYGGAAETIEYDGAGRPQKHTYPGGESVVVGYTNRSQVSIQIYYKPDGVTEGR